MVESGDSTSLTVAASESLSPEARSPQPASAQPHSRHSPQIALVQGAIQSVVQENLQFLSNIESQLYRLESSPPASREELARNIFLILKQVFLREVGPTPTHQGVARFLERLCAEGYMRIIVERLTQRVAQSLHTSGGQPESIEPGTESEQASLLRDLREFVNWYGIRRASLSALDLEASADELSTQGNRFFGIDVLHDRSFAGVHGLEVIAGARIQGHRFDQLWVKLFVRCGDQLVLVNDGWHHWSDESEARFEKKALRGGPIVALMPIMPDREKIIVDSFHLFIPYDSLDLPHGSHAIELELGLYHERGEYLCGTIIADHISVPSSKRADLPIPSPHALGLWSEDPVSCDRIAKVSIKHEEREVGEREIAVLKIGCDIELFNSLPDQSSQIFLLEVRLLTERGALVESRWSTLSDSQGSFLASIELELSEPLHRYFGLSFEVPELIFDLDEGQHRLLCEVAVLARDGRVICGTIEPLIINGHPEQEDDIPFRIITKKTGLFLEPSIVPPRLNSASVESDKRENGHSALSSISRIGLLGWLRRRS